MTFCAELPAEEMEKYLNDEEYDDYIDRPRIIYIYLNKIPAMPEDNWHGGVPNLYWKYEDNND